MKVEGGGGYPFRKQETSLLEGVRLEGGVMAGVWCVLWSLGWLWHDGKPHSD